MVLVLIVEDNLLIGWAMRLALQFSGHVVRGPATTAAEALQLARETSPALALIDIDLDRAGGGIEVARTLKREHQTSCVFVTGNTAAALAAQDVALGVIEKPFDPETAVQAAEAVFALRQGRSPAAIPPQLRLFLPARS
jgi:DNA-binding NarL/FixJ family response regulator